MRKIYSLVLMAMMLLVGTNAWATTHVVGNETQFNTAWKNAQNGDVIQLNADFKITKTYWLGTTEMSGTAISLTLDLNGHILTNDAALRDMFLITKGELNVITSVAGGKIIQDNSANEQMFLVTGSTYKNLNPKTATSGYFAHLTIGEGVTIDANKNALVVDVIENQAWKGTTDPTTNSLVAQNGVTVPAATPYKARVYKTVGGTALKGVANGVRIDVYGKVKAKKYAIKANGDLGSPSGMEYNTALSPAAKIAPNDDAAYTIAATDVDYSPYIRLYENSDLSVPASNTDSKKPVAVYCSGYARFLIEGHCVGSTGVYVKSGIVDINDANIESNYTGTYVAASATNSGVTASGSGIVIESNAAYAGDINVTVGGSTTVTAPSGYAIDESVTSATNTEVDAITITDGVYSGGKGAIIIDEKTADANVDANQETTVKIGGGVMEGTVTLGESSENHQLSEIIKPTGTDTEVHYTTVTVPGSNGQTTMVVSSGAAKTSADKYTVTLNANGLATFSANEAVTIPAGLKAYSAYYAANSETLTVNTPALGEGARIPAITGVILYGTPGESYDLYVYTESVVAGLVDNNLKPSVLWNADLENVYILHGTELWQYTGSTFRENKAFLQINSLGSYAPQRIRMVFNQQENATAVENVEAESVKAVKFMGADGQLYIRRGDVVYTVQGQVVK